MQAQLLSSRAIEIVSDWPARFWDYALSSCASPRSRIGSCLLLWYNVLSHIRPYNITVIVLDPVVSGTGNQPLDVMFGPATRQWLVGCCEWLRIHGHNFHQNRACCVANNNRIWIDSHLCNSANTKRVNLSPSHSGWRSQGKEQTKECTWSVGTGRYVAQRQ